MPNRHYVPSAGRWPRWLDHLGAHLNEVGLSFIAIMLGALVLVGTTNLFHASLFLIPLGVYHELALSVPLLVGGMLSLTATLADFKRRRTYWLILRSGLVVETIGWLSYSLAVTVVAQQTTVSALLTGGIGILRFARFLRTLLDEHRIYALTVEHAYAPWKDQH